MHTKRYALILCNAFSWLVVTAQAQGTTEGYPSRPVRFILPYTPGGAIDVFARALAQHLTGRLGQPVIVENRPGASQAIALEAGAKAAPDGHFIARSDSAKVLDTEEMAFNEIVELILMRVPQNANRFLDKLIASHPHL